MATVTVDINGRNIKIACNDGEDAEVLELAAVVDRKVREVVAMVGQLGEERLLLMAAMLLADELAQQTQKTHDAEAALSALQADNAALHAQMGRAESEAADRLETAAGRVERVLENLSPQNPPQPSQN